MMIKSTIIISASLLMLVISLPVICSTPITSSVYPDGITISYETKVTITANISEPEGSLHSVSLNLSSEDGTEIAGPYNITFPEDTTIFYSLNRTVLGLSPGTKYIFHISVKNYAGNWTNSSHHFFTATEDDDDDDDPVDGENITIIPAKPRSGRSMIIIVEQKETTGYMICEESGNAYLIPISNGIGLVELDEEFGKATVVFPGYGSKTFEFSPPFDGELYIDVPPSADLNRNVPISVYGDGQQKSAKLTMISPTGHEVQRVTSEYEPLQVEFGTSGNWTLIAELYGIISTRTIFINPQPIDISIPSNIRVGEEFKINVGVKANGIIEMGNVNWKIETDDRGDAYFTAPWAGRYKISITTQNQQGLRYFSAQARTNIMVKDDSGSQVNTISEDDIVLVQLLDSQGNPITSSIRVMADGVMLTTLELTGGSSMWRVPRDAMVFLFDFASTDSSLTSSSLEIAGTYAYEYGTNEVDNTMLFIALGFIAIIAALYFLHSQQIIDLSSISKFIPLGTSKNLIDEEELF